MIDSLAFAFSYVVLSRERTVIRSVIVRREYLKEPRQKRPALSPNRRRSNFEI